MYFSHNSTHHSFPHSDHVFARSDKDEDEVSDKRAILTVKVLLALIIIIFVCLAGALVYFCYTRIYLPKRAKTKAKEKTDVESANNFETIELTALPKVPTNPEAGKKSDTRLRDFLHDPNIAVPQPAMKHTHGKSMSHFTNWKKMNPDRAKKLEENKNGTSEQ